MTMRGFDEDDFREVGAIIADALVQTRTLGALARSKRARSVERRPLYPGFRRLPAWS